MAPVIHRAALGWWSPDVAGPTCEPADMHDLLTDLRTTIALVHTPDGIGVAMGGRVQFGGSIPGPEYFPLAAILPPLPPEELGDHHFCQAHHLKYPYMTGAMANGIASVDIIEAMSHAGMLGSFGAAGLSIDRVTQAIDRLQGTWARNHSAST